MYAGLYTQECPVHIVRGEWMVSFTCRTGHNTSLCLIYCSAVVWRWQLAMLEWRYVLGARGRSLLLVRRRIHRSTMSNRFATAALHAYITAFSVWLSVLSLRSLEIRRIVFLNSELPDAVPYSVIGEASVKYINWPTAVTGSEDTTFCAEVCNSQNVLDVKICHMMACIFTSSGKETSHS